MFKDCFSMWLSKTLKVFFYEVDTFKASTPGKNKYTILTALKWVFAQRFNTYTQVWKRNRKIRYSEYPCETYFPQSFPNFLYHRTGWPQVIKQARNRNLKPLYTQAHWNWPEILPAVCFWKAIAHCSLRFLFLLTGLEYVLLLLKLI